ncbi:phosphomannomutase-like protein [Leptomonas pyrrhocoris]|uniref:Phosphomannomutase-like protein n=1 Tax=Leptomonas pyrrhocoris TaxID=157538 RepID=A0A0N0VG95_LEPPY|nr:phosphomannomutase-like protein [Leptomonas pyrrhocoris]XP_015660923.1 phosphomannomutase-like protein [Leptomonas pyrrhocoris]KPA82483.1 phosphomannomutase-like protein [Leptomonas pyrrhocoris]KPA82484.1 phosphomannomutase-like protein [Leptomonas pyrrhocoris]|eukprot:XP_015660922.1 phosphomannomutase-like protein [Leptomonas pyrrhocoris]
MSSLDALVKQWLEWDHDPVTRAAVEALVAKNDTATLQSILGSRMTFGTAGLRATMGPGNAHMNRLTVLQTAQGLAAYLREKYSASELSRGIVIGFDGRHNSRVFAEMSATVMHQQGLKTYLYRRCAPTPFVPYGVTHFKALAGVMVTASHNPKEYNGFKVYAENGAQIVSPIDQAIAASIEAHLTPLPSSWAPFAEGDHIEPYDEVFASYFKTLQESYAPVGDATAVRFTYTAMHGVGTDFTTHALRHVLKIPEEHLSVVPDQARPDPDFPTIRFPNPEEGKTSLALSFVTADRNDASIVLANDPDADRLAVAERLPDGQGWKCFTGNELGTLLGWWAIECARRRGAPLKKCLMLSTVVSSCVLRTMAVHEGVQYSETLTGFKFMGNVAMQREAAEGLEPIFAFEEAIGFMWGRRVMDKDGVTAATVMADMACYLRTEKHRSLVEQLEAIYKKYGYHFTYNSYTTSDDPAKTGLLLEGIRTSEDGHYPTTVDGRKVTRVVDLVTQIDTAEPSGRSQHAKEPLITLYVEGGIRITIRGSGTEPKIKWYAEIVTEDPAGAEQLNAFVAKAVEQLMQPKKFGLVMRPEDIAIFSKL